MLERNTRLPAQKVLTLPASAQDVALAVFRGSAPTAAGNEWVGAAALAPSAEREIDVLFAVGVDGLLRLTRLGPNRTHEAIALRHEELTGPALSELLAHAPPLSAPPRPNKRALKGLRKLLPRA